MDMRVNLPAAESPVYELEPHKDGLSRAVMTGQEWVWEVEAIKHVAVKNTLLLEERNGRTRSQCAQFLQSSFILKTLELHLQ